MSSTSERTNRVSYIPFVGNPHFSIVVRRLGCHKYFWITQCSSNFMNKTEENLILSFPTLTPKKQNVEFNPKRYNGATKNGRISSLFKKLELQCERFVLVINLKILFHKISVDLILSFPNLTRLISMELNPQPSV